MVTPEKQPNQPVIIGYTVPYVKFTDIEKHWAKESIDYVVGRGLFGGISENNFAPDAPITLEVLATALCKLSGDDVSIYKTSSFTDVNKDSCYLPYMKWAYQKGIIEDIGINKYDCDRPVTREEMAVILKNYAKATGCTLPVICTEVTFTDNSDISSYSKGSVKMMQQAGILMGGGKNRFNPRAKATRAEIAAALHRYIRLTIDPAAMQEWTINDDGKE